MAFFSVYFEYAQWLKIKYSRILSPESMQLSCKQHPDDVNAKFNANILAKLKVMEILAAFFLVWNLGGIHQDHTLKNEQIWHVDNTMVVKIEARDLNFYKYEK